MSREEIIQLMELLDLYVKEHKVEQKSFAECENKQELATQIMIASHMKAIDEIRQVLCFEL